MIFLMKFSNDFSRYFENIAQDDVLNQPFSEKE